MVTRRAERLNAQGAVMMRTAFMTLARLLRGSPMPMKTTLVIWPDWLVLLSCQICSTICPVVRLSSRPSRPDAQKVQPTGQPTWLETQAVCRDPPPVFSEGIMTHSVVGETGLSG